MTLSEYVSLLPPRQIIRIGTVDGIGFVFKGMVKNVNNAKFGEREVVDAYAGIVEPEQLVVIIDGKEKGKWYNPKMPQLTTRNITDDAVNEIIGFVYREPAQNLIYAYQHERERIPLQMEKDALDAKIKQIQSRLGELNDELERLDCEKYESEIREAPFVSGGVVIHECRTIADRKEVL